MTFTEWWNGQGVVCVNDTDDIIRIAEIAFAAGRKAGMEEAAEIARKTTAPVSIGRDKGRHHIAGAQHAAKIIRAKMEEKK